MGLSSLRSRLPPAIQRRDFGLFVIVVLAMGLASQMIAVAIGWQVYDVNHQAFDLGLIGLLEFAPVLLLAIPAGQLSDAVSRRVVMLLALGLLVAVAAALIVVSADGAHRLWPFLALATANGVATAISFPASRSLPPMLVEHELMGSAMTIRSVVGQAAMVGGPAIGGLLFAISPELVYATALTLFLAGAICMLPLRVRPRPDTPPAEPLTTATLLAGVRFIQRAPILLGAITLDLFAVLFGGAVALLPVFAQAVLHVGPAGLGVLRSAPAIGAVMAGVVLVRHPLPSRAGPILIACVCGFGASIIVFGVSRIFLLSAAALLASGAFDMFSVNIRTNAVTFATPDWVRGRVGAVESVFIGASNQLGAFESGTAAALLGAIPAVIYGGVATILIALAWTRLFPSLAGLDRLEDLEPVELDADAALAGEWL
ncbi:MAG TPA: MFS transporter [Solirubrobacteraceae bacterium]|nr:MFS transporter [Solirubrobacteraceae bacterium]